MRQHRGILLIVLILAAQLTEAQEVITSTFGNPLLTTAKNKKSMSAGLSATPAALPFYDDFSSGRSFPDPALWEDNYVFINNTFSNNQLTQGMATFDALDQRGALYDKASYYVFAADTLTSKPVDLALTPADSVWLSFLYEPGGLGDKPEASDSLTLQFYSPSELKWHSVWSTGGGGENIFTMAMVKITDTRFLSTGFRFRFINYASLSAAATEPSRAGNADQWNVDCVLLDKGRTVNDRIMHDVAFTKPLRSLLNNMEAMPWNQFKKAYLTAMGSVFRADFRNNDDIVRNVTRGYTITDVYRDVVVDEPLPGATNVAPLSDNTFEDPLLFTYSSTTPDSALFMIRSTLITDDFDPKENDTITYYQKFSDYFAYDDGTAEAGYGINGEGSDNAMVALRYRSFISDSVAGIRICFNDAVNNANQRYFYMVVWADDDGRPGEILATSNELLAKPASTNNGFVTFLFDKPVFTGGYFWVGWKQASETFLNVGLDMNTPHQDRLWYWINGNWYISSAPGTILLRAVMTGDGTSTSTDGDQTDASHRFSLWPNPATGSFTVTVPGQEEPDYRLAVYNLAGTLVMTSDRLDNVNISHLPSGSYLVVIKSSSGKSLSVLKLIKSH